MIVHSDEGNKGVLVFLGGDSYSHEKNSEARISRDIAFELNFKFIPQTTFIGGDELNSAKWRPVSERLRRLQVELQDVDGPVVLFGRSSGARVATLYAQNHSVNAVVCFAYPFRQPGKPIEVDRYMHLATSDTPTLIAQGVRDVYGGIDIVKLYQFSAAVQIFFVNTDHCFEPKPESVAVLKMRIHRFLVDAGVR